METVGRYCLKKYIDKQLELSDIGAHLNLTSTGVIQFHNDTFNVRYESLANIGLAYRLNGKEFDKLFRIWKNEQSRNLRKITGDKANTL